MERAEGDWVKCSWEELAPKNDLFFVGKMIQKIEIGRFSKEYEINAAEGEIRPQGGDYFGEIFITFENGRVLRIEAQDALFDGWMDMNEVNSNEKEHWTVECGYRDYLTEII